MRRFCILVIFLTGAVTRAGSVEPCAASAKVDKLPGIIAPMVGHAPVWFVDGSFGRWAGENVPVTSVWIVSRSAGADLMVTGQGLNGNGTIQFRSASDSPPETRLTIHDPAVRSMTPGGASAEVMAKYAFVSSYLLYPAPGCWALDVQYERTQQRIIVKIE
jgi:hypothetical protein